MDTSTEILLENLVTYLFVGLLVILILYFYLRNKKKQTSITQEKISRAQEMGFHEPVSLHPVVNPDTCIGSAACIAACPENDILGLVDGKAKTINASRCVGHGACFHACPVEAISLVIGTEKRGVELPHVGEDFQTNVPGVYIAGELGGMGLIKNAVEQGKQAVDNIKKSLVKSSDAQYDVIIIGAGPAGISGSLNAKKHDLKFLTLEQDTIGGTVYSFPRAKIVMTSPMDLPLFGKVKLNETSKDELITLWTKILHENNIKINENEKVTSIEKVKDYIKIKTVKGEYTSSSVLISIGRRGSPRKLGVPGENSKKVYYRLLEPELIHNKNILVVGGGDSAVESALLLAEEDNNVTLSYRSDSFKRIKPKNLEKINSAASTKKIRVIYNSVIKEIKDHSAILSIGDSEEILELDNDLVFVFAGGELPNKFLEQTGIKITKKFGETVLKH